MCPGFGNKKGWRSRFRSLENGTIDDKKRPLARQHGPITVFEQEAYNIHVSVVTKTMSQLTSGIHEFVLNSPARKVIVADELHKSEERWKN